MSTTGNKFDKSTSIKDLRRIPGVGPVLSEALYSLGIRSVDGLKGREPEELYMEFCKLKGLHVDRCVLYVFRLAVYFASTTRHDPKLLKWWNWKERLGT
ncbi:MAG: pathogenicity locus [Proteobacteria bacterium]|nr:pathogenicity locus [Pseudomonadota bacterium]